MAAITNRSQVSASALDRVPAVVWVLVGLIVFFSVFAPGFFSGGNFLNIALQGSVLMILALAATVVILTEGIDLSLGSLLTLSGVIAVLAIQLGVPAPLGMLIGVSAGLMCGTITGALISWGQLPPFIASLGMLGMAGGLAVVLTNAGAIYADRPFFVFFGSGRLAFLPMPVVIAAITYLVTHTILYHTPFGSYIFALGGNEEGAALTGVNTRISKFGVYAMAGILAGVAGVVMASRLQAADPVVGVGWEFDAIAATILGGTSFEEGRGGIAGTLAGVALIAVLRNGLNVIGLATAWQAAVIGSIIIAAIVIDVLLQRNRGAQ
jgi:ribose transport system permease protein